MYFLISFRVRALSRCAPLCFHLFHLCILSCIVWCDSLLGCTGCCLFGIPIPFLYILLPSSLMTSSMTRQREPENAFGMVELDHTSSSENSMPWWIIGWRVLQNFGTLSIPRTREWVRNIAWLKCRTQAKWTAMSFDRLRRIYDQPPDAKAVSHIRRI